MKVENLNSNQYDLLLNLPDWYLIKRWSPIAGSSLVAGNRNALKLLGFNDLDEMAGKKYLEMKCKAAEFANQYHIEDEKVVLHKETLSILYYLKFADDRNHLLYAKKGPLISPSNNETLIFSQAYFLNDKHITRFLQQVIEFDIKRYHNQTSPGCYYFVENNVGSLKLPKQQHACLYYLLRGKTAKQIGQQLSLSTRTTEYYIDILKNKFKCETKSQLIEHAIELGYLYYLPKMSEDLIS